MRRRASTRSSRHGAAISCTPIGSRRMAAPDRHRADRQADERDRLRRAGPGSAAPAGARPWISSHSAADRRCGARRRRRDQDVDVAQNLARRASRYQRAQALRLHDTTPPAAARRRGSGRATAARSRPRACAGRRGAARRLRALVITKAAARAALDLRAARPRDARAARCATQSTAARAEPSASSRELAAEDARCAGRRCGSSRSAAVALDARDRRTPDRRGRGPAARRSTSARSRSVARERAEVIEAGDERKGAVPRQPAVGRLQAEDAAQRRRHADRAVGVRAER